MLSTILFFGLLCATLALILASAWLVSRAAYLAILALTALTLATAELRSSPTEVDPLVIAVDIVIFGFIFYFVTVQKLMKRKASQITSREDFKSEMESQGQFTDAIRGLYHLPVGLLLAGIATALVGAMRG